jgi:hypothetical protein
MAITVPKAGDVVDATTFGAPVANAINKYVPTYYRTIKAASQVVAAGTWVSVNSLVLPVIPTGLVLDVWLSAHGYQATAAVYDFIFQLPWLGTKPDQVGGTNGQNYVASFHASVISTGIAYTIGLDVNAWGAQPVTIQAGATISARVYSQ